MKKRGRGVFEHNAPEKASAAAYRTPSQELLFEKNDLFDIATECIDYCNSKVYETYVDVLKQCNKSLLYEFCDLVFKLKNNCVEICFIMTGMKLFFLQYSINGNKCFFYFTTNK